MTEKEDIRDVSKQAVHTFIESFRWCNFRGFEDTGDIELHNLDIIIGPNNAGKSSLITPLLLLKQTITAADLNQPLVTKGYLANIGSYSDFVSRHDSTKSVKLDFRFHGHNEPDKKTDVKPFGLPPGEVQITLDSNEGSLVLTKLEIYNTARHIYISRTRNNQGRYTVDGPIRKILEDDGKDTLAQLNEHPPSRFLFPPVKPPRWDENESALPVTKARSDGAETYNSILAYVDSHLMRTFAGIAYIGPMRERPERFYAHTGQSPSTVGPRGENAYEILYREYHDLHDKLTRAMQRLALADSVECEELSKGAEVFKVNISIGGMCINLADAGFGISQLLPILIQGYRKRRSARSPHRLIVKQPEIHLNPAQQSVFAELLLEMMENTSVLLETHSEHLLLTVRRLIADKKLSAKQVAVYFVERTVEGMSSVRRVPISNNGHISERDWPSGFFAQSLQEAMRLAMAQAARAREAKKSRDSNEIPERGRKR